MKINLRILLIFKNNLEDFIKKKTYKDILKTNNVVLKKYNDNTLIEEIVGINPR